MESEERLLDMPALQLTNDCDLNQVACEKRSSSGDTQEDEQKGFADTLTRCESRTEVVPVSSLSP